MHDAVSVQIGQCPEQRSHSGDRLTGSELSTGADELAQAASYDLIEDQRQRAVGQADGMVLADQMLVLDPVALGHLLGRQCARLGCVRYR